jgi:hypothetical protein
MAALVGVLLALAVCGLIGTALGFDRDRAFYPTIAIVVALLYALFAVMAGSPSVLAAESIAIVLFVAASILGFTRSLWFAVAALIGHGLYDAVHGRIIANPGVPAWWPAFCGGFDVAAGLYLAVRLIRPSSSS